MKAFLLFIGLMMALVGAIGLLNGCSSVSYANAKGCVDLCKYQDMVLEKYEEGTCTCMNAPSRGELIIKQ